MSTINTSYAAMQYTMNATQQSNKQTKQQGSSVTGQSLPWGTLTGIRLEGSFLCQKSQGICVGHKESSHLRGPLLMTGFVNLPICLENIWRFDGGFFGDCSV